MVEDVYKKLIMGIVIQTRKNVGGAAITQANTIDGLKVIVIKDKIKDIEITDDPIKVTGDLVEKYIKIMGPVALTIAKKVTDPILKENPELKLPEILK